jgi:hypothetical protein
LQVANHLERDLERGYQALGVLRDVGRRGSSGPLETLAHLKKADKPKRARTTTNFVDLVDNGFCQGGVQCLGFELAQQRPGVRGLTVGRSSPIIG